VDSQWARNVLQLLLADIFVREVEFARGTSPHPSRYANSSCVSQAFEPGGNVYGVTKTRLPLDLLDLGRRGHPGARCQGQEQGGLQPHQHGREVMECWATFAIVNFSPRKPR